MTSLVHGTDLTIDKPQEFAPCNSCYAGMMMLHSNGVIECESCHHRYPVMVDGTPIDHAAGISEDADAWQ